MVAGTAGGPADAAATAAGHAVPMAGAASSPPPSPPISSMSLPLAEVPNWAPPIPATASSTSLHRHLDSMRASGGSATLESLAQVSHLPSTMTLPSSELWEMVCADNTKEEGSFERLTQIVKRKGIKCTIEPSAAPPPPSQLSLASEIV